MTVGNRSQTYSPGCSGRMLTAKRKRKKTHVRIISESGFANGQFLSFLAWVLPAPLWIECLLTSVFETQPLKSKHGFLNVANCLWVFNV